MRRGPLALGLAAVLAAGLLTAWLSIRHEAAEDASSLSRGAAGWLAARRYLEERGAAVRLLDEDAPGEAGAVVVTAFPWQSRQAADWARQLEARVRAGARAVVAYDVRRSLAAQEALLGRLGLETNAEPRPPADWSGFQAWHAAPWRLEPEPAAGRRDIELRAPRVVVQAPEGARVLYRDADGRGVVFVSELGSGELLVVPSDVLSNARLGRAGNAELLEWLLAWGGDRWEFDEYHHGLRRPVGVRGRQSRRAVDLFLLQLALLYVLAIWALAPRLGEPWRPEPVVLGTAESFLLGLGARHDQLGHHAAAARLLLERSRELDPRLELPPVAEPVRDRSGLVEVARAVGREQARLRRWT